MSAVRRSQTAATEQRPKWPALPPHHLPLATCHLPLATCHFFLFTDRLSTRLAEIARGIILVISRRAAEDFRHPLIVDEPPNVHGRCDPLDHLVIAVIVGVFVLLLTLRVQDLVSDPHGAQAHP